MAVKTFLAGQSNDLRDNTKNSLVSLRLRFKNPAGNPVNIKSATGRLLHENKVVENFELVTGTVGQGGVFPLAHIQTGLYAVSFLTVGLKYGIYKLEAWGNIEWESKPLILRVEGTIEIGEISMIQYYVTSLRVRLMDDMVSWYRLDEPIHQWPTDTLATCLMNALSHINIRGPRQTNVGFESVPEDLIITGGLIYALESRARIEIANTMNYTDGHSLNVDRSPKYTQLAQQLRGDWDVSIEGWKKSTPPTPIVLKSQRLPFRIFRVIGMLPNYQSYFESIYS